MNPYRYERYLKQNVHVQHFHPPKLQHRGSLHQNALQKEASHHER